MADRAELEKLFREFGFEDFRWIDSDNIVISQWVRMKCLFGCSEYGRNATCPPNVVDIPECKKFISEYEDIAVFHFEKKVDQPEDRHAWTKGVSDQLLELERKVFISGQRKAFLLAPDSCHYCTDCTDKREECKLPKKARPTPEGMGIDVFATVREVGFPIEVLSDYDQPMNRYAFLLVD